MRTYPGFHIVVSAWLVLSCAVPLTAQDETPVVSFPYGTQVEISATGAQDTQRIPAKFADGVDIAALDPVLRDVQRGNVRAGFENAFTVEAVEATDTLGPGFQVTVSLEPPLEPGTYKLFVEVPAVGNTEPVETTFQVVVPDAKVQALGTLAVTHIEKLGSEEIVGSRLRLRETGERSRLTGWSLVQLEATGPGREPVTARLTSGSPPDLEAGSSEKIFQLESEGEFPLGETQGKLELDGPQLAAPVTLQFEYLRRLHPWWLLVPVILGIVVGYLVRVWLARRAEKLELESQAHAFFARVAKERGRYKDSALHTRFDEIEAMVRPHLEDSDKLPDQLTAAQEELKAALEKWAERQAEQKGRRNDLTNLLSLAWQIPGSMRDALRAEEVQEGLKRTTARLDEKDPTGAADELDEVETTLKEHLASAADAWRDPLESKLDELELTQTPLLEEAAKWAASPLTAAKNALKAIPADAPEPKIRELLTHSHDASVKLGDLVEALDLRMRLRVDGVLETLASLELPDRQIFQKLETDAFSFFESPNGTAPDLRLRRILGEGPLLDGLLVKAMVSQIEDDTARDELKKLLRGGSFDRAQQLLQSELESAAALRAVAGKEGHIPAAQVAPDDVSAPRVLGAGAAAETPSTVFGLFSGWLGGEVVEVGETAEAQRLRTVLELFAIKFLQLVFAGVLILLASYFVFAEIYLGTAKQNIGLFFWAFALDLSIEGALSVGKVLKPKTG